MDISKTFERVVDHNNRRAYKNGGIGSLTIDDVLISYQYFNGRCAYSGKKIEDDSNFSLEHIIPIISGGDSIALNCIPVINKYNSSKSGYHLLDWWNNQNDGKGNTIYNPYRLLKIVNYILKSLESLENNENQILQDNKIDQYLKRFENLLYSNIQPVDDREDNKKLSSIEAIRKINIKTLEEEHQLYENVGSIKIDLDVFLSEAIEYIKKDIKDEEIIRELENLFNSIGKIVVENKVVYSRNDKRVEANKKLINWLRKNKIENAFGIAGYTDLEFLESQNDIEDYLEARKQHILKLIGIDEMNFNTLINKVPNILTNTNLDKEIESLTVQFSIDNIKDEKGSSELYRYIYKKPELLFLNEIIEKLAKYYSVIDVDKKMLKRGIPLPIMLENLETILDIVNEADLQIPSEVRKRVIKKFFDNSNGNSVRMAYENLKRRVKNQNNKLSEDEITTEAARWIICISEKYDASKIFKERCINKTKKLYKDMKFDKDGYMIGVNKNAYYVPQIVELANLNISKEAESVLVEDFFTSANVRKGVNINFALDFLKNKVREQKPNLSEERVAQEAARWLIFISENAYIMLDVLYNPDIREEYVAKTAKHYKNMNFDESGNYINIKLDGIDEEGLGIDYMNIVNMFFKSNGQYCYIAGKQVKKKDVYNRIKKSLESCRNKKMVREVCLRTLKQMSAEIKNDKKRGVKNGQNER